MIINQAVVGGLSSEKIFFAFPFNFNEIFFFFYYVTTNILNKLMLPT